MPRIFDNIEQDIPARDIAVARKRMSDWKKKAE
jgi:hypothetical protein